MAAWTSVKALTVALIMIACCQGATARPSDDLISAPAVETTSTGRHLTQSPAGPASAGCAAAGVSCCYSPTWWIEQQVGATAKCTTGTYDSSMTPEVLLQACEDVSFGETYECFGTICGTYPGVEVTCTYYENLGDYTGPFPCTSNVFDGETIIVYDSDWLIGSNDEVVWEDATVASNEPTGVAACDGAPAASYTFTATYSKSSSWNIGIQLGAKILSDYEAKLTASYSQSYSAGTNAGITVAVPTGSHGTVTREILGLYSAALTIGYSQTFTSGANGAVTVDVATGQHGTITRGK
ncbi:TPA: hypothetical protein ACH3X3_002626 [Trebouxia sp. C0006]